MVLNHLISQELLRCLLLSNNNEEENEANSDSDSYILFSNYTNYEHKECP